MSAVTRRFTKRRGALQDDDHRPAAMGGATGLLVAPLGAVEYDEALALQERLRDRRIAGGIPDVLLVLEHPSIYTLGRGADAAFLGRAGGGPVPVRRVGRGGQVTYHGPGQVVAYPIVDLRERGIGVGEYVRRLEDVIVRTVAALGLHGAGAGPQPGVWIDGRKLASIGIGVRRFVTTHGLAVNVCTELSYFAAIVPCGLRDVEMTSLVREGLEVDCDTVGRRLAEEFAAVLGYDGVQVIGSRELEIAAALPVDSPAVG
jgi:lipoate-protein ligase B